MSQFEQRIPSPEDVKTALENDFNDSLKAVRDFESKRVSLADYILAAKAGQPGSREELISLITALKNCVRNAELSLEE